MGNKISYARAILATAGLLVSWTMAPLTGLAAEADDAIFTFLQAEQLEYRALDGDDLFAWDVQGWAGTDYNKLAIKTEGEAVVGEGTESAEVQVLYKRLISPFFDLQVGVRHDLEPDPSRSYGVVGIQGLAPYFFEVDTSLFLSDQGDVSGRLEAEYELPITQRLVLQPSAELNVALSSDREIGVGSGVNDLELGLRLRYEIVREVAPYIGVHWEKKFAETADFAREEGEGTDNVFFVAGVRFWF